MAAFKFAVADRLPLIPYATLMDGYVLSSFTFVFGIIIAQLLAKLGRYEEMQYVWSLNETTVGPDLRAIGMDDTLLPNNVTVAYPLVSASIAWGAYHILILIVVWIFHIRRRCYKVRSRKVAGQSWGVEDRGSIRSGEEPRRPGGPMPSIGRDTAGREVDRESRVQSIGHTTANSPENSPRSRPTNRSVGAPGSRPWQVM